jgi:N-methylhydantoinase A
MWQVMNDAILYEQRYNLRIFRIGLFKVILLGIDTGGTFTDFILYKEGNLVIHKVLSTPKAPELAILQGIKELQLDATDLLIVHGSTVATNALLEGKGVTTAYITNFGLADVLSIGRQTRRELYNLQPEKKSFPVEKKYCLETGGRLSATSEVIEPLTQAQLDDLLAQIKKLAPDAVAINLLFSYLDDTAEKRIAEIMPDAIFVSRSSAVLAEYKEYERGIATWLNSYVGPLVQDYLKRLQVALPKASIAVMQSAGGTIAAKLAGQQAVHMLLSGPAGGLAAAKFMGDITSQQRLLTFDMGGTSTDVAMIDGELQLTSEGEIAGYPVAVSMVDMHTIGAGGGSIASIDAGGLLQVGPESAGADPGPACYGKGGKVATVTDANLLLGRLRADAFLGGDMSLII